MYPNSYRSPANQANSLNKKLMIGIVGGVLALVIGVGLIVLSSSGGSGQTMARVVARHAVLLTTASNAQKYITGSELRRINSDAVLFMNSDAVVLNTAMQNLGINAVPKEIAALEADTTTTDRLAAADAAGRFDSTYVTVLSQKIDAYQALLTEARGKIGSPVAKAALRGTYERLENVQQQINKL